MSRIVNGAATLFAKMVSGVGAFACCQHGGTKALNAWKSLKEGKAEFNDCDFYPVAHQFSQLAFDPESNEAKTFKAAYPFVEAAGYLFAGFQLARVACVAKMQFPLKQTLQNLPLSGK